MMRWLGKNAQTCVACSFLVPGILVILFNLQIANFVFISAALPSNVSMLMMFGYTSLLVGLAVALMIPTVRFYSTFAIMVLPMLAFNAWGYGHLVQPLPMALDAVGNVFLGVSCWAGALHLADAQKQQPQKKKSSKRRK